MTQATTEQPIRRAAWWDLDHIQKEYPKAEIVDVSHKFNRPEYQYLELRLHDAKSTVYAERLNR